MELEVMCPPADLMEKVRGELQQIFLQNAEVLAARCTEVCVQQVWAACFARLASQAELLPPPPVCAQSPLPPSRMVPTTPAREEKHRQSDAVSIAAVGTSEMLRRLSNDAINAVASSPPTRASPSLVLSGATVENSEMLPRQNHDAVNAAGSSPKTRASVSSVVVDTNAETLPRLDNDAVNARASVSSVGETVTTPTIAVVGETSLTEGSAQPSQVSSLSPFALAKQFANDPVAANHLVQSHTSVRSISPACHQSMQQKMESRFGVVKDGPRCSFFGQDPTSSPAVGSTASGFSPKGESAVDKAAVSENTSNVRGRSPDDGRRAEEIRRASQISLSYYSPLTGSEGRRASQDLQPQIDRQDAVPSASSAATVPLTGAANDESQKKSEVRKSCDIDMRALEKVLVPEAPQNSSETTLPPQGSTATPPAPSSEGPSIVAEVSPPVPTANSVVSSSGIAHVVDDKKEVVDEARAPANDESLSAPLVVASSGTEPVVDDKREAVDEPRPSANDESLSAPLVVASSETALVDDKREVVDEPRASANDDSLSVPLVVPDSETVHAVDDRREIVDEPRTSANDESLSAPVVVASSETAPVVDDRSEVVDEPRMSVNDESLRAPPASSSAVATNAPSSSSTAPIAALESTLSQPPRWLTNPPLSEDCEVNVEDEIKALQLALGDLAKELSVLEPLAGADGTTGNDRGNEDIARLISSASTSGLSGSDDLATEQREFQVLLEAVSLAAAAILDERDRSTRQNN